MLSTRPGGLSGRGQAQLRTHQVCSSSLQISGQCSSNRETCIKKQTHTHIRRATVIINPLKHQAVTVSQQHNWGRSFQLAACTCMHTITVRNLERWMSEQSVHQQLLEKKTQCSCWPQTTGSSFLLAPFSPPKVVEWIVMCTRCLSCSKSR